MREVDPTPRTSHVTPPFWELSTLAAAIGRWGLARFSALHNAPGCGATRDRGMAQSHAPPHAKIPGDTATCPGGALPPPPSLPLTAWRSGRGHARPFPKWGTSCQLILSPSSNEGLQWFSRPPGIWHRVCASESKSVCTPVAPPLEPSLCSQLPTPLWWRSRSPALPTAHSAHQCRGMHCTCCTMCMPAPAPCVAWVRAVCAL